MRNIFLFLSFFKISLQIKQCVIHFKTDVSPPLASPLLAASMFKISNKICCIDSNSPPRPLIKGTCLFSTTTLNQILLCYCFGHLSTFRFHTNFTLFHLSHFASKKIQKHHVSLALLSSIIITF